MGRRKYQQVRWKQRSTKIAPKMILQKKYIKFKHLLQKGNGNWALRSLTNNINNGILPFTDEIIILLRTKHSEMQNAREEVLLQGPIKPVHPSGYKAIDEKLVPKNALKTNKRWLWPIRDWRWKLGKNPSLQIIWIFFLGPLNVIYKPNQNILHQKLKYINQLLLLTLYSNKLDMVFYIT